MHFASGSSASVTAVQDVANEETSGIVAAITEEADLKIDPLECQYISELGNEVMANIPPIVKRTAVRTERQFPDPTLSKRRITIQETPDIEELVWNWDEACMRNIRSDTDPKWAPFEPDGW